MKTIIFLFARGGSRGVPHKNVRMFAGKPLIVHTIDVAKSIPVDKIFVSTEDILISEVVEKELVTVIPRPTRLAADDSPEWLSWQHAVKWVQKNYGSFDRFVCLPVTAPLRHRNDICKCIEALESKTDIVLTVTESSRSPWFNMVNIDPEGLVKPLLESTDKYWRRQDVPRTYDLTTVAYVSRPEYIINSDHIFSGRVRAIHIPRERALDIDTEFDLEMAEFLFMKRKSAPVGNFDA